MKASKVTEEKIWRLPLEDDYRKDLKSNYADIKNVGSRWGGAITAAVFLSEFVNNTPWAHLDIAGCAWDVKNVDIYPENGASGFGVHLLQSFIESYSN